MSVVQIWEQIVCVSSVDTVAKSNYGFPKSQIVNKSKIWERETERKQS